MSGHKRWSKDADETAHPDDGILLAYIREQPLDQSWQDSIYQHIARCTACQKRCKELRQTSILLNSALRVERRHPLSPSDAESGWDWVQSPQAAQRAYGRRWQKRQYEDMALIGLLLTRLPFVLKTKTMPVLTSSVYKFMVKARQPRTGIMVVSIRRMSVAFLMLLSAVLVLVYTLIIHNNPLIAVHPDVTPTRSQSAVRLTPQPTSMPTVVSTHIGGVTGTSPSGGSKPTIFVCMSKADRAQSRIDICGVNFKPGDRVELFVTNGNNGVRTRHPVLVDASGRFEDSWYIYSCKEVPATITVQDAAHPSIVATLDKVPYNGKCYPDPIPTVVTVAVTHHH